ncbi:unnamed protein product, partial [Polarella glacialis]
VFQAVPSRVPFAGAGRIAPRVFPSQAAAVLQAPTPSTNSKIQPQLQNLPRFHPPVFEGLDGQLPRPDSPCSTPRSVNEVGDVSGNSGALRAEEMLGPFAPGSFVEYKSRSSGQWILAKVESHDSANQSYRLDVQPHAHADRVRSRGFGSSSSAPALQAPADLDEEELPQRTAMGQRTAHDEVNQLPHPQVPLLQVQRLGAGGGSPYQGQQLHQQASHLQLPQHLTPEQE